MLLIIEITLHFDAEKFELKGSFIVQILNPYYDSDEPESYGNITIMIEYDVEEENECISIQGYGYSKDNCLDPNKNIFHIDTSFNMSKLLIILFGPLK